MIIAIIRLTLAMVWVICLWGFLYRIAGGSVPPGGFSNGTITAIGISTMLGFIILGEVQKALTKGEN